MFLLAFWCCYSNPCPYRIRIFFLCAIANYLCIVGSASFCYWWTCVPLISFVSDLFKFLRCRWDWDTNTSSSVLSIESSAVHNIHTINHLESPWIFFCLPVGLLIRIWIWKIQHWGLDLRSGFLMLLEMWFGLTTLNCNLWVVVDIPLSHADQCTEMKLRVLMWKNYPMGMEYDKYCASPRVNIFLLC